LQRRAGCRARIPPKPASNRRAISTAESLSQTEAEEPQRLGDWKQRGKEGKRQEAKETEEAEEAEEAQEAEEAEDAEDAEENIGAQRVRLGTKRNDKSWRTPMEMLNDRNRSFADRQGGTRESEIKITERVR
jgi:hypothetical protein